MSKKQAFIIIGIFFIAIISVEVFMYTPSDKSMNEVKSQNVTTSNLNLKNQTLQLPSFEMYNGKNMTILYVIPLKVGEMPLNKTTFSSIITQAQEEKNYTLIQITDQRVLQTSEKNIIAGKDSIVGTEQIYKSVCDPNQLVFLYANGTKITQSQLEVLSSNKYLFKSIDNPYCKGDAKGLKILDFKIIR